MIKINKRPLPDGVKILQENDYRSGVVLKMIIEDFHDKCYICEDLVHTAPNIEHRIPHKGDLTLKYDWNNLFLACSHCNNTKQSNYIGIIDPTKVDPEKYIELSLDVDDELREMVVIRKIGGNTDVDITIRLLDAVYNGTNTDMKKYACQQLKNKVSNELSWFHIKLEEFKKTNSYESKKAIERSLFESSVFAAFKRRIIHIDSRLSVVFYSSLESQA